MPGHSNFYPLVVQLRGKKNLILIVVFTLRQSYYSVQTLQPIPAGDTRVRVAAMVEKAKWSWFPAWMRGERGSAAMDGECR